MISCRPPRRAMGPAGTVDGTIGRFLLPIGGGSAEGARKSYFLIKDSKVRMDVFFNTDISAEKGERDPKICNQGLSKNRMQLTMRKKKHESTRPKDKF